MAKRAAPEVNAGSMADIAFLLLIFFLVTTTIETDSGLNRKLPPMEESEDDVIIKEKNIFQLEVNRQNQLFLKTGGEEKTIEIKDLRKAAVSFLDNGGGTGDNACQYCQGEKNPRSSDNFQKAIISLQNDRATHYDTYIAVQNEIIAAYNELRNREFRKANPSLDMSFVEASNAYSDARTPPATKAKLKEKLQEIKERVPQIFSEAEPKKSN